MKFFICALALVAAASAAPFDAPGYEHQPLTKEGLARVLEYNQDQKEDGAYQWNYETENGIKAGETNVPHPAGPDGQLAPEVQGEYSYPSPDGSLVHITYTAGEQGFVAQGSHIPQAPPIPEEILRSLEWNAAHPEEEAQWDPDYKGPAKTVYHQ